MVAQLEAVLEEAVGVLALARLASDHVLPLPQDVELHVPVHVALLVIGIIVTKGERCQIDLGAEVEYGLLMPGEDVWRLERYDRSG